MDDKILGQNGVSEVTLGVGSDLLAQQPGHENALEACPRQCYLNRLS